jgi:outer membrane receptor protein involved in Fe transport
MGLSLLLVLPLPLAGQEAKSAEEELLALLNTPITVASKKASSIREQPGIVTLVTRHDIQNSGARDLMDVLSAVPGFSFAKDVQGVVGPTIRGLWGYEGKVLLLIDGMEMNDPMHATTQLNHHFPADLIQRVEVIRGPGSAIYGGNAELAVINVITRSADDLKGGYFAQSLGRIEGTEGHTSSTAAVANVFQGGKYSLTVSSSEAPMSNQDYTDLMGNTFSMARQSNIRNTFASLGLEYERIQFRGLLDQFRITQREHFNFNIEPEPRIQTWDNYYAEIKRPFQLTEAITITPSLQFRRQFPWGLQPFVNASGAVKYSNKRVDRTVGGLQVGYDPNDAISILSGVEHFEQKGKAFLSNGQGSAFTNGTEVSYTGNAFFAQGLFKTPIVNITLGARYENHSLFESSFVPRLCLTKVLDKVHFKVLVTSKHSAGAIRWSQAGVIATGGMRC